MGEKKIVELVRSMTLHDEKSFKNYLVSPFFNCREEERHLFNMLVNDKKSIDYDKKILSGKLFPGSAYNDKRFRYVESALNQHLIKFYSLKQLDKEELISDVIAARALSTRECDKAYMLLHHEIENSTSYRDASWYYSQFEHAETHLVYSATRQSRKVTPDYNNTLVHLDSFYLVKKLQLSCEVTNLANVLNKEYEITLLDPIRKMALTAPYDSLPSVTIYYNILEMLLNPSEEKYFTTVEQLLSAHASKFHPKELGDMYQYLKNYCVKKVNQGSTDYLRILFNIYKSMLANKTLMNYDYLSQWEYKNIVSISLRLNENQWCETFINKYISYLKPETRENALAYNQAYYLFITNEYKKSIRKLQEVNLNDVFYQLDSRVILLKCYFELDETDSFFYQASAFRLFLLRNRSISEYQKNIYRNLIRFLTAIVRAKFSKAKLKRIRTEIEKERNVADLNWLRTKAEEALDF